jgi:EpsI family protein
MSEDSQPRSSLLLVRRRAIFLAAILAAQGLALYGFRFPEALPAMPRWTDFPEQLGSWRLTGEEALDAATDAILKPDASLVRGYRGEGPDNANLSLFIGYFKTTQPNHPGPHSPTVCLPAAGWREVERRETSLVNAATKESFASNEYILEKSGQRLVVLYWYQNVERGWAKEVLAKVYLLPDYLQYRRSDVALVRVTALVSGVEHRAALAAARNFATEVYPAVRRSFRETLK